MSAFWEEWTAKCQKRYDDELAAGLHDRSCEQAPNFRICHCSKRRREAEGYTEPPGELIHQYPLCPRCYCEVGHDGDSFHCDDCRATWPDSHGTAEFADEYGDLSHSPAVKARMEDF